MAAVATGLIRVKVRQHDRLRVEAFGRTLPHPIGLAAGFDKDGLALRGWPGLGLSFVEVGTVTPRPQPGNEKPRLFRLPEDRAIVNRMGFNNQGSAALRDRLPTGQGLIPIGINLGKNKSTAEVNAAEDYRLAFADLHDRGDYFVINVSSPNTPGLRDLQAKSALIAIVEKMRSVNADRPFFIKVAPDLDSTGLDEVLEVALNHRLAGLIATNTTISRTGLAHDPNQAGGLSGAPLRERSNEVLRYLAEGSKGQLMLIGVGGIFTGAGVQRKLDLGANLVQVYTGLVYGGPWFVPRLLTELIEAKERK